MHDSLTDEPKPSESGIKPVLKYDRVHLQGGLFIRVGMPRPGRCDDYRRQERPQLKQLREKLFQLKLNHFFWVGVRDLRETPAAQRVAKSQRPWIRSIGAKP